MKSQWLALMDLVKGMLLSHSRLQSSFQRPLERYAENIAVLTRIALALYCLLFAATASKGRVGVGSVVVDAVEVFGDSS